MRKKGNTLVKCSNCGKEILKFPFQIARSKHTFCNRKCHIEYNKKNDFYKKENHPSWKGGLITVKCDNCGKSKLVKPHRVKDNKVHYCSMKCQKEHKSKMTGDKAYNWRGGLNSLQNNIRKLTTSKDYTKAIFERDNYTCQVCGNGSNKLQSHHLIGFTTILRLYNIKTIEEARECNLLWDLSNSVTMCKDCHREFHNQFGIYKFTPEDYYQFRGGDL